jgi:AcrR family transcriptional regulator
VFNSALLNSDNAAKTGPGVKRAMENAEPPIRAKPARGRPRNAAKVPVVQRLLDASEALLRDHSHVDLTERKIAAAAGVDIRMIHYYFGDKDGLIFAVIARYCDTVSDELAALDAIVPGAENVTRQIYKVLVGAYYGKPWIARVLASELAHAQSPIKQFFIGKYGLEGDALARIRQTFKRMIALGVYDAGIDVAQSAVALFLMSLAPVMVGPAFGIASAEADWFKKEAWLDFVADLFDRKLLGAAPPEAQKGKQNGVVRV